MISFLVFILGMIWLLITGLAYLLAWVFNATFCIAWVVKILAVSGILAFLFDIFTSYKGNEHWF